MEETASEGLGQEVEEEHRDIEGTGAPMYDGSELEDLFATLDAFKSPQKEGTTPAAAATV